MANTSESLFVIDASFALAYLLPDEAIYQSIEEYFKRYEQRRAEFVSTPLLPFEVMNGLRSAVLRKCIDRENAKQLANLFMKLDILVSETNYGKALTLAIENQLTVYDASYLLLSREEQAPLLTLDKSLAKLAKYDAN